MKRLILSLCLFAAIPAHAISLTPMGQKLDQSATVGSLRVHNNTTSPARYQVVVDKLVVDSSGRKSEVETSDFRFYPATLFELAPGQTQTLRWKRENASASEQAYLVKVQETPLSKTVASGTTGMSLVPVLRFELLWTFSPAGAEPQLRAKRQGGELILTNEGSATARLNDLSYPGVPENSSFVLLPGESKSFKGVSASGELRLVLNKVPTTLIVE